MQNKVHNNVQQHVSCKLPCAHLARQTLVGWLLVLCCLQASFHTQATTASVSPRASSLSDAVYKRQLRWARPKDTLNGKSPTDMLS